MHFSIPNCNHKLFIVGQYQYMDHIPGTIDNRNHELLDRYYNGFKIIADNAVDYLIQNSVGNAEKDQLTFPIIFNYRHYIELILKNYAIKFKPEDID